MADDDDQDLELEVDEDDELDDDFDLSGCGAAAYISKSALSPARPLQVWSDRAARPAPEQPPEA